MTVRVRFAPSPTGFLHIGGARTALFNWLYARRHKGVFVLRIEDTDQGRSTPESVQAILDGMKWLGLDWDEGPGIGGNYGPYFQMQRLGSYKETAEKLIAQGKAYRCYATEEEVNSQRKQFAAAQGLSDEDARRSGFKFKSPWRDRVEALDKPHVVRFKTPERSDALGFEDLVLGKIEKPYSDFDDFVMMRSDGIPLYNFGCVVDDHLMEISHIGRGQEHINSTFPQLMLYDALGWAPPRFGHFPLILGQDREKLSKRKHPEADVMVHRENGVLPDALVNFVARIGWSHGNDEIFTRAQLIEMFDLVDVGKTSGSWNPEKLSWTNQQWIKMTAPEALAQAALPFFHRAGLSEAKNDAKLKLIVQALRERATSLVELADKAKVFYGHGVQLDAAAALKHLSPDGRGALSKVREKMATIEWNTAALDGVVKTVAEELKLGMGKVAQPIRVAVTGNTVSPGIGETLEIIGRDESLHRIDAALTSQ